MFGYEPISLPLLTNDPKILILKDPLFAPAEPRKQPRRQGLQDRARARLRERAERTLDLGWIGARKLSAQWETN